MRRLANIAVLTAALLLSHMAAPIASATTAVYLTEVEHAEASDAIIVGRVGVQRVDRNPENGRIYTHSVIHVDKTIVGEVPVAIEIHQMGGELDGHVMYVPGDAELVTGEQVLLFVRQVEGRWYLTAMEQSKYRLEPSLDGTVLARELHGGLFLRGQAGKLVPFHPDDDGTPMTLARLIWILADAGLTTPDMGGAQ